jgi:16S rRNA C967 or C1407 C5-methylase (RsmB/RsmF family)/NOL1/NOP2/fmu family ribosome biogenesis protein
MVLPDDFIIRTKQLLGDEYALLEMALQGEVPVSIRINLSKQTSVKTNDEKVKWCETGYYLPERPSFTFDPLFHAGCYYVQEASSMFLEQVVKQYITTPVVCLDLCAAPGGKSTHLTSLFPDKSLLVSNEVIHSRANVLKENLIKWGSPYTVVTCNDPKEIGRLTHLFDVIVADLPCSGEGMFRKDLNSRNEWSEANVQLCAARQRRIIHDVWNCLKPGGLLVYSTCTFNREENEENIRYLADIFNAEVLPVAVEDDWNISTAINETFPLYRFFPHKTKGEGFCLALLKKPDEERQTIQIPNLKFKIQNSKLILPSYNIGTHVGAPLAGAPAGAPAKWAPTGAPARGAPTVFLRSSDSFHFDINQNTIQAIPALYQDTCRILSHYLRVINAGVSIGEIKGKDLLPAPALALNTYFRSEAFPSVELTMEETIRYLHKEALVLSTDIPKGFIVVKYRNTPLGFVKNIGNRANNLYPQEWRIRRSLR